MNRRCPVPTMIGALRPANAVSPFVQPPVPLAEPRQSPALPPRAPLLPAPNSSDPRLAVVVLSPATNVPSPTALKPLNGMTESAPSKTPVFRLDVVSKPLPSTVNERVIGLFGAVSSRVPYRRAPMPSAPPSSGLKWTFLEPLTSAVACCDVTEKVPSGGFCPVGEEREVEVIDSLLCLHAGMGRRVHQRVQAGQVVRVAALLNDAQQQWIRTCLDGELPR